MSAAGGPGRPDGRALALRAIDWLVDRHHQSLGLWPWAWSGPDGEPYVTLYAACTAERFAGDFAALAAWVEANRWPPPDGRPHPATLYRDRLTLPAWSLAAPRAGATVAAVPTGLPNLTALAAAGAALETIAQLLAAAGLDDYLATLAPQRHGGHAHRTAAGRQAARVMRLATGVALALGEDYAVPWVLPTGGRATGSADPDWGAFTARYRLRELPCPPTAHLTFAFGERGWLHADGWAGDRRGNVLRLGPPPAADDAPTLALLLRLLDA